MKTLALPYIGIKIESIPTIIRVLDNSQNEEEFLEYYMKLGKSRKTASEYLRSLRNLKLAKMSDSGTVLLPVGRHLIQDNIEIFYENLLKHCLSKFPDLKVLAQAIKDPDVFDLETASKKLRDLGYTVKRERTLSSFLKLFAEAGKKSKIRRMVGPNRSKEPLEYNQILKLLSGFVRSSKDKKQIILDFFDYISTRYTVSMEEFVNYLEILQRENKIKMYPVNIAVLGEGKRCVKIGNLHYYFFEVI